MWKVSAVKPLPNIAEGIIGESDKCRKVTVVWKHCVFQKHEEYIIKMKIMSISLKSTKITNQSYSDTCMQIISWTFFTKRESRKYTLCGGHVGQSVTLYWWLNCLLVFFNVKLLTKCEFHENLHLHLNLHLITFHICCIYMNARWL